MDFLTWPPTDFSATVDLLRLKRQLRDYCTQGSTVGYSKDNKIITVDFHDSREILFLNHISMQMCFIFSLLFIFNSFTKEMPGGNGPNGRSGTAVFRENLVAMCTQDRRLWIWIYSRISMDTCISMDIHEKSVDMDMDMDGKFHIHGKPVDCRYSLLWQTLRFEWHFDVAVRSSFLRSWELRLLETRLLFDVLCRPINDNTRVFDAWCVLSPCWHWKLCHYLALDRFSCNSIGRGKRPGGTCPEWNVLHPFSFCQG